MKVIGLLTTEEEAHELQYIAQICTLEKRIHLVVQHCKIYHTQTFQKKKTIHKHKKIESVYLQ